ncbi:MAG: hypothetical protein PHN51_01230 [Candidatus Nanopelagicales bacterium]|nr:hypothetical protein [Candidatus Nanopelagicales bacterium]
MANPELIAFVEETYPLINKVGGAYYFTPETLAYGKSIGLNGLQFYFGGRGGVLGDVEEPVITSAFAYFAPSMVKKFWDGAKAVMPPRQIAREHFICAHEFGRNLIGAVEGLVEFNAIATKVRSTIDPAGLALYAGLAGEPMPADPQAAAYQHIMVLREFRGSAHIVAILGSGLDIHVADAISSPENIKVHGYPEDALPIPNDEERAIMEEANALTNELTAKAYATLTPLEREHFVATLTNIANRLPQ